jgi:peptidoglycan/xylan/chitin deacetylase (PgdA/CDA1 family)
MPAKKDILAHVLDATGLGYALRRLNPWRGLMILNYHRIGEAAQTDFDPGVFSASAEQFDRQLNWLKTEADVIGLNDLDAAIHSRRQRSVLITFDDGYRDNYDLAFPVLQRHKLPATFFITTGFIDDRPVAWWDEIAWMTRHASRFEFGSRPELGELPRQPKSDDDRRLVTIRLLKLFKKLPSDDTPAFLDEIAAATRAGRCPVTDESAPWMTWAMVREIQLAGHSIGAHTVTHPILANCTVERQRMELAGSKSRLETQLGATIDAISYPVGIPGSFSDETQQIAQQLGYRWAFSFQGGYVASTQSADANAYALPRVAMEAGLSPARFRALQTLPSLYA